MYTFTKGYPQSQTLYDNPDTLTYYLPIYETHAKYYADSTLQNGVPVSVVYTQLPESTSNKYLCYIGGDTPVCVIESAAEGGACIVLKESYGNAFVPFLTSHYSKIIVIDPREFNRDGKPSMDLDSLCEGWGDRRSDRYQLSLYDQQYGVYFLVNLAWSAQIPEISQLALKYPPSDELLCSSGTENSRVGGLFCIPNVPERRIKRQRDKMLKMICPFCGALRRQRIHWPGSLCRYAWALQKRSPCALPPGPALRKQAVGEESAGVCVVASRKCAGIRYIRTECAKKEGKPLWIYYF